LAYTDSRNKFNMINSEYSDEAVYKRSGDFVSNLLELIEKSEFRDAFVFHGVSLWDAIAPLLAAFILPEGVLIYAKKGKWVYWGEYLFLRKVKVLVKKIISTGQRKEKEVANIQRETLDNTQKLGIFLNFTSKHFIETFSRVSGLLKESNLRFKVIGSYEENIPKGDFLPIPELSNDDIRLINDQISRFQNQFKKINESRILDQLKNKFPIEYKVFQDNFGALSRSVFPVIAASISRGDSVISSLRPRIIIGGDDCDYRARVYFLLAKMKTVPTLLLQQGLASYKTVDFMFLSTDKIAVIGEDSYIKLLKMGVPAEKMIITGRPGFDSLVIPGPVDQQGMKDYLLFTSQPYVAGAFKDRQSRRKILEQIYSLSVSGFPIIIKPHPGEKLDIHRKLSAKFNKAILADKNCDTNKLIKDCGVFITCSSTTALQAMIAGKPVIIFNYEKCSEHSPYYGSEAVSIASTYEELTKVIKYTLENKNKILSQSNKEREDFIKFNTYLPDGNASGRILGIINEMLRSKELKS